MQIEPKTPPLGSYSRCSNFSVGGVEKNQALSKKRFIIKIFGVSKEKKRCVCARKYTVIEKPMKEIAQGVGRPIVGQP